MFLSMGLRFKADVEALNMSESIGNVKRHRRVPVVIREKEGYKLIYVPAISGESIAHAYQYNLVKVAETIYNENPPIDEWSKRGEFIKFADNKHLTPSLKQIVDAYKKSKNKNIEEFQHTFEKTAIKESIVADIGGFLYAEKPPVRRTSIFQTGYAVPIEEAIKESMIEAQVHARHVLAGLTGDEERKAQMLYYIEIASSIYGVTMNIDFDIIGKTSMVRVENAVDDDEIKRRIKTAIGALALTLGQGLFGAKRTRFNPILEVTDAVLVFSAPLPFTVSPPQKKNYICETINRAKRFTELLSKLGIKHCIKTYTYNYPEYSQNYENLEELLLKLLEELGI